MVRSEREDKSGHKAWKAGFLFEATTIKMPSEFGLRILPGILPPLELVRQMRKDSKLQIRYCQGRFAGSLFNTMHTPDTIRPLPFGVNARIILFGPPEP